jgi:polysaccharide biosynthesis transport protein
MQAIVQQTGHNPITDVFRVEPRPIAEPSLALRDYLGIVRKHLRLIVGTCLTVVLMTAGVVFTLRPQYQAETTLLIEHNDPAVLNVTDVMSEPIYADEYDYYNTEFQLLKSRDLASRVILGNGLLNGPLLHEPYGLLDSVRHLVQRLAARLAIGASESPDGNGLRPELVDRYLRRLDVSPVRNSRLVKVAFETPDPRMSAAIVNDHALAYIQSGIELRSSANKEAEEFLGRKLVELGERLRKSEAALNRFRKERGIISFEAKEDIGIQRLDEINKRYLEAQLERISLETQMVQIRAHEYDSLGAVVSSPLIQQLKVDYNRLTGEYAKASAKYKPGFPLLEEAGAQVAKAQTRLHEEIRSIAASVKAAFQSAVARENQIRASLEEATAQALKQKEDAVQYRVFSREVEANRDLYDAVLQRMKETALASELRVSKVFVVDRAEVPTKPSTPAKARDLLISAVLGLMGAVSLAFLAESVSTTFRNHREVEQMLNLPSLAVIPDFRRKLQVGGVFTPLLENPALALSTPGLPTVAEPYRMLRATLLFIPPGSSASPKTLLITSAIASEGKTTTAVNTAISLAAPDTRVLLIDADFRRARCHQILSLKCEPGLNDVLRGDTDPDGAIQSTAIPWLFFLGAGAGVTAKSPSFGLTQISELLKHWRRQNDYIIIDSPPILLDSGALLLSALVEGTVLVIDAAKTTRTMVEEACSRITFTGGRTLGVVFNKVQAANPHYYGAHYY